MEFRQLNAEVPVALDRELCSLVRRRGWVKKRTLIAALHAFMQTDATEQARLYELVYLTYFSQDRAEQPQPDEHSRYVADGNDRPGGAVAIPLEDEAPKSAGRYAASPGDAPPRLSHGRSGVAASPENTFANPLSRGA